MKKALGNEKNPPLLPNSSGDPIPIRSVRIQKPVNVKRIGTEERARDVVLGSNHHLEIVAVLDEEGNEKSWEGAMVTLYDAYQRKQRKESIVTRDHEPGKRFKFSLCGGDTIHLFEEDGLTGLFRVRTITQEAPKEGRNAPIRVEFVGIDDARQSTAKRCWYGAYAG